MRLVWLTDIHLNFLNSARRKQFYKSLQNDGDVIVISGDIADADMVVEILQEMADAILKPIYFVLGNHDYYGSNVDEVRHIMKVLTTNHPLLQWLGACEPIKLNANTIILGEDGWADGRYGDYTNSFVRLNDSTYIEDLFQHSMLGRFQLLEKMQQLADRDADNLKAKLKLAAAQNIRKIIVLTHVPPFKETALYEGKMSDDDHLPFFSSKATGDVLMSFAKAHPSIQILVLCGHTHDGCEYQALDNLMITVGKSEYDRPCAQAVIEIERLECLAIENRFLNPKISIGSHLEKIRGTEKGKFTTKEMMDLTRK